MAAVYFELAFSLAPMDDQCIIGANIV